VELEVLVELEVVVVVELGVVVREYFLRIHT
jgi:hypothetical protein